ncbi:MAG: hypothetical protein OEW18_13140 [Candidatus Aminicenantes bacterium]|nr:hypothetical protein [Candidatus Aminicenantes bacterium]
MSRQRTIFLLLVILLAGTCSSRSVALKCGYVRENRTAGVIIWELTQDDSGGEPALLRRVGESFRERQDLP